MYKRTTNFCDICKREISLSNYYRHRTKCESRIVQPLSTISKDECGNYICPFCSKIFPKFGISIHVWRTHCGGNSVYKGRPAWNKGLTKDTNNIIKEQADRLSERLQSGELKPYWLGKHHTEETKNKLSKNSGGYRKGSGRGKHGWYKGHWCDSTWELAWIIYNIEHEIKFQRNTEKFEYEWEGKKCHYTPDFILEDGSYIEIKGIMDEKNKVKISSFKGLLRVLHKNEIEQFLEYAKKKYGEELELLYDNAKPKFVCRDCGIKISNHSIQGRCNSCAGLQKRKTIRPSIEQLRQDSEILGYSGCGRKYGVTHTTIKRWLNGGMA